MIDSNFFRDQMTIRRLRLAAGLVMLSYLTLHLSMHALGNVSFEAMQWGTRIHDFIWHSVPGTIGLYRSLAIQLFKVCRPFAYIRHTPASARSARDLAGHAPSTRTVATASGVASDDRARGSYARSKCGRCELGSRSSALLDLCCAPCARFRRMGGALVG